MADEVSCERLLAFLKRLVAELAIGINMTKQELKQNLADLIQNYGEWPNEIPLSRGVWRKAAYRYDRLPTAHVTDPSKTKMKLGWEAKTKFKDLVRLIVGAELRRPRKKHI